MVLRGAQGDHPSVAREAPAAEDAQPSQAGGSWKAQEDWAKCLQRGSGDWWDMESPAGSSGGSAEGASEGRQPLTGPHLPPAAKAAKTQLKEKPPRRRPKLNK